MQAVSLPLKITAVIGCILLIPILVLVGLTGFFHVACHGDDDGLDWALLTMIVIPAWNPFATAAVWAGIAIALIFGVRPTKTLHRFKAFTVVGAASVPMSLVIGLVSAWISQATVVCMLGSF